MRSPMSPSWYNGKDFFVENLDSKHIDFFPRFFGGLGGKSLHPDVFRYHTGGCVIQGILISSLEFHQIPSISGPG